MDRQTVIHALEWYRQIGVDEWLADTPQERTFKLPELFQSTTPPAQTDKKAPAPKATPKPVQTVGAFEAEQEARALAQKAKTLVELEEAVRNFDGNPLKFTATQCVFADGNPETKIMFIGEGPGADEDRQGKPFVGTSGQLLSDMLSYIGLKSRDDYYITNTIHWRPPGNRDPSAAELAVSLPFVHRHIELVAPRLIVLVGNIATKNLLATNQGIMRMRGKWVDFAMQNGEATVPVMPIFHPAYLLRQPSQRRLAWHDLIQIRKKIDALTSDK